MGFINNFASISEINTDEEATFPFHDLRAFHDRVLAPTSGM